MAFTVAVTALSLLWPPWWGGSGITRLLSYQVAEHLRAGRLTTLLTECEAPSLPVHVVHREGRHAPQRVRAFIDLAVERLRAEVAVQ